MVKMGIDENRLYSVTEAAKILNVSKNTMLVTVKETPIEYFNLNDGRAQFTSIRILGANLIKFLEDRIVTGERKPLYEVKARKTPLFRGLQGRC
jgi:hypothetical protein